MTSLRSGVRIEKMIKCIVHRIKNIFSFSEEAGRLDFFITHIALIVVAVSMVPIGSIIGSSIFFIEFNFSENIKIGWWQIWIIISLIFLAITLLANLCRRLNDLSISRWAALILFVPILNILFELYVLFATGKKK
jgi:uncharacterized membrane protein YhaH (DUF805 family)